LLAGGAAALPAVPRVTWAQAYPTRPVRWVVPYPPGGGTDPIARMIGERLSQRLGQPFVIENRGGGGANIGTEGVAKSPADGYTLLFFSTPNVIKATLYDKLNFDFIRDFAAVAGLVRIRLVMVVHPSVPAKTVREFIAYAKNDPGKINMSSSGVGTSVHVAGELFSSTTGIKLTHVPYRGSGPALIDLLAGQVQVMFDVVTTTLPHIKSGKLRALGAAFPTRLSVLPDVPSIADTVPGYEAAALYGVAVLRGTPTEVIANLNREINAALADPTIGGRLTGQGSVLIAGSPADFGAIIAAETEKWGKVIRAANIKP